MRIVFAGTPDFSVPCLKALINSSHDVIAVYTQPDRPAGRGRKLTASPIKQVALEHGIEVYQPKSLRNEHALTELKALKPDLMIVIAYGLLLPQPVLDTPRYGCINVHASVLPRWRGAAPIHRAILAGDDSTGVTIMQMDAGLDTGDMLTIKYCPILPTETTQSLHDKLSELGATALLETLDSLEKDSLKPVKQDDNLSTYANKINKSEGVIDWRQSASSLERQIRALTPWPSAYTHLDGKQVKVHQASIISDMTDSNASTKPGTILLHSQQGIVVACGKDALCIERLQLPGAKALSAKEVLNAKAQLFAPGTCFEE